MKMHYVTDKWGKPIVVEIATVGKLKAILTWMEGVVYRYHRSDLITDMTLFLPDDYGIILEELAMRKAKPYIPFQWVLVLKDKEK